jgi:hypothetical protein
MTEITINEQEEMWKKATMTKFKEPTWYFLDVLSKITHSFWIVDVLAKIRTDHLSNTSLYFTWANSLSRS